MFSSSNKRALVMLVIAAVVALFSDATPVNTGDVQPSARVALLKRAATAMLSTSPPQSNNTTSTKLAPPAQTKPSTDAQSKSIPSRVPAPQGAEPGDYAAVPGGQPQKLKKGDTFMDGGKTMTYGGPGVQPQPAPAPAKAPGSAPAQGQGQAPGSATAQGQGQAPAPAQPQY